MAGVAPLALGQVTRPVIYNWVMGGHPYTGTSTSPTFVDTPDFKSVVLVWNTEEVSGYNDPALVGERVAKEVFRRVQSTGPDHLDPSEVAISFWTFGRDDPRGGRIGSSSFFAGGLDCDSQAVRERANVKDYDPGTHTFSVWPPTEGVFYESPIRFFTEGDRIPPDRAPDPGLGETEDSVFFPVGVFDAASSRTYRNPVKLANARSGAPLAAWMNAFLTAYKDVQDNPENYGLDENDVIPTPTRVYLDNETHDTIGWVLSKADLWMLYKLALSYNGNDSDPTNYWSNPIYDVPGTGGKTLKNLYDEKYTEVGNSSIWPASILSGAGRLREDLAPDADENRRFMLWYTNVCRTAQSAVLDNCFYNLIGSTWPNCKILNYASGKVDGEIDTTGWYMDTPGTKAGTTYPTRVPSNQLVRGWHEGVPDLMGKYWDEPSGDVWSVTSRVNDTVISSPVLYRLVESQFLGWDAGHQGWGQYAGGAPHECAQQPNLYLTRNYVTSPVLERLDETSLRLFRHTVESAINSGEGQNEEDVIPWISLAHMNGSTPKFLRHLLSMLRAHDITEIIGFSGSNVENTTQLPFAVVEWNETQRVLNEVYASWVDDYEIVHGEVPTGGPTGVDTSRLEYVLRDSEGSARTVDIESEYHTGADGRNRAMTILDVKLDGFVNGEGEGYFSTMRPDSVGYAIDPVTFEETNWSYGYVVNLECQLVASALQDNAYGTVEVYNWAAPSGTDPWVQVYIRDSVQDEKPYLYPPRYEEGTFYPFNTSDRTVRLTLDIHPRLKSPTATTDANKPLDDFVSTGVGSTERGTMRFRFKHVANNPCDTFVSKYDLVQVIPFRFVRYANGQYRTNTVVVGTSVGTTDPSSGTGEVVVSHDYTPYEHEDMVPGDNLRADRYYSSSVVRRYDGASSLWETSFLLDTLSTPPHSSDWFYSKDNVMVGGKWVPAGYDADTEAIPNTRLVTTRFNQPTPEQKAVAVFTLPVWTDAPAETSGNLDQQPYTVWYWLTPTVQWMDVTQGMQVDISRDPADLNNRVVVSSRSTAPFQAGYYALTLNLTPPVDKEAGLEPGERYAVFTGGSLEASPVCDLEPGSIIRSNRTENGTPILQYNFRIYPDCNNDGLIDDTNQQCDIYGNGPSCPADLDDGTMTGQPDAAVDINDLIFFLTAFEDGLSPADLDDGSMTGTPDFGVDINDLLYFLVHFEWGC